METSRAPSKSRSLSADELNLRLKSAVFLTCGDADGIGLEVAVKAIIQLAPKIQRPILLFRSGDRISRSWLKKLNHTVAVESLKFKKSSDAFAAILSNRWFAETPRTQIFDIECLDNPALWVKHVAEFCQKFPDARMVTGPLSKETIYNAGLSAMGHTGILKAVSKTEDLRMAFFGTHCNVILVTDHIPLKKVESSLTRQALLKTLKLLPVALALLPADQKKLPVAILGLNPHAGENGLIGNFEKKILMPVLKSQRSLSYQVISADSAFLPQLRRQHSLYLALYHDQGLIPFKTLHGFAGVHVTLGLRFLRVSVDHGTAKEIFNQNVADPQSMIEALRLALNSPRLKS